MITVPSQMKTNGPHDASALLLQNVSVQSSAYKSPCNGAAQNTNFYIKGLKVRCAHALDTHVNVAAQIHPVYWYFPVTHYVHAAIHSKSSFICRKSHLWMQFVIMNSMMIQLTEITRSHGCSYYTSGFKRPLYQ
jgi:hypothetical protein